LQEKEKEQEQEQEQEQETILAMKIYRTTPTH
jgi:hypothetical protein